MTAEDLQRFAEDLRMLTGLTVEVSLSDERTACTHCGSTARTSSSTPTAPATTAGQSPRPRRPTLRTAAAAKRPSQILPLRP
jgi:hypothetical protein